MAEGGQIVAIVARLNDTLECSICMGRYTDPRILDCLHSYCLKCIKAHVGDSPVIRCPLCNDESLTPRIGVEGLKSNFFIRGLIEDVMSKKVDGAESKAKICGSCDEGNASTSHCDDCACKLCADCVQLHANLKVLKTHKVTAYPTEEEIQTQVADITTRMSHLKADIGVTLSDLQANIARVKGQMGEINKQRSATLHQVQLSQQKILDMVNRYVTEMNVQINENAEKRMGGLAKQLTYYERKVAAYSTMQKQAESIHEIDLERRQKLSKELESQLDEYKNKCREVCVASSSNEGVCCMEFVAGTPDYDHCVGQHVGTVESVVRCHIGLLTPTKTRDKRTVNIWIGRMSRKMQEFAVQCAHNALDDHYMNRNTSKDMLYIATHIHYNFTNRYRRGNWNCFVWKGILGYLHTSKNQIMLNVDNFHICISDERDY